MPSRSTAVDVKSAIAASNLRDLPDDIVAELTADARRVRIAARSTIHHEGEAAPHLELVLGGLVRVQISAADGRMMTVRYCRAGDLVGVATLYASVSRQFSVQAASDAELLRFRPERVRRFADDDPRVAQALLLETSERVMAFVAEFSGHAFSNVRQRLVRHLMDLALDQDRPGDLLAPITQQELADAIGSVREVVVRVLRELREEGAVLTGRDGIVISDPELLSKLATLTWNEGS